MIARSSSKPDLSRSSRSALALAALAAVLIFPTWAESPAVGSGAASGEAAEPDADASYRESVRQLEREAAALESELRAVHARRMEIEREWHERRLSAELDRLRGEADALEAAGQGEAARETRRQAELLRLHSEVEHERARLQQDVERQIEALRERIEHTAIASQELRARGDEAAAEALEAEQLALERRLESVAAEVETRQHRLQAAQLEVEIRHLQATVEHLRDEGRNEEAAEVERQLDLLLEEMSTR